MNKTRVCLPYGLVICLLANLVSWSPIHAQERFLNGEPQFHIVGYLPDYRVDQIDPVVGQRLTDLVFFSVIPESRGQFVSKVLDSPKTQDLLKRFRDEHQVKIHLCVGGWDRSQGFAEIAANDKARRLFSQGLIAYCLQHGFAGADLDWEHPKDLTESTNYGILLSEIAKQFKPHHLRLTAAMAAWQTLTPQGIEAVDAIHLMSYDAPGRHSTLETAQADVRKLIASGVPANKIRLGLPFYGRGIHHSDRVKTYAEIVASAPKDLGSDEIDGLYFNGPGTIQAKTRYAREKKLSGVMVWEIGQDATGDASLLKVIRESVK